MCKKSRDDLGAVCMVIFTVSVSKKWCVLKVCRLIIEYLAGCGVSVFFKDTEARDDAVFECEWVLVL